MTQPLNLALTLSLNDRLLGPLQKSFGDARRVFEALERDAGNLMRASDRTGDALGKLGQKGRDAGIGLRAVGQEAAQAEARVSRLHSAMDRLSRLSLGGAAVFGAFAASKHVLQAPMNRGEAYELSLAKLSNVLFNDRRTVAGRQAGQGELDQAVRRATLQGVTREEALSGLRVVGAAGGIDRGTAMSMLPTLAKYSVAGEASMEDVANIAVKGMKIGEAIAKTLAFLGSQDAKDAIAATEAAKTQQAAADAFASAVNRMANIDFGGGSGDEIRFGRAAREARRS